LDRLPRTDVDLVIASRSRLREPVADLVRSIRELPERPEIVVVSSKEDAEDRARLLAAGCMAVVLQSLADSTLAETVLALTERQRQELNQRLRTETFEDQGRLDDFVASSPAIQAFMRTARRVADSDSSVLLLGETGVGKERLARAIHHEGARSSGPFVAVNCGALPEGLLESELFGHEEGAFTGATRARRGYFELAHRGTLFLDEIGDLPLHLQVKLLRALERRSIQRVGGERSLDVDTRVMAATNRDLEAEVASRRFRADLYYRLAVVTLTIPPLRERREDIPELIATYLDRFSIQLKRPVMGCTPAALDAFTRYSWPGNVRELINVIERAVLLTNRTEIDIEDLPPGLSELGAPGVSERGFPGVPTRAEWRRMTLNELRSAVLTALDREYLTDLLTATRGRVAESAQRAGITERALYNLMKRHSLRKEDFKPGSRPDQS
jgi:DNA-binding NtrC family response regulator